MFLKRSLKKIGTFIRIDETTLGVIRGKYAKLCFEVIFSKLLLSKFKLERKVSMIEYEGLQFICFWCGRYGHHKDPHFQGDGVS